MPSAFRTIYIASGIWQTAGWASIMSVSYTHLDVYKRQLKKIIWNKIITINIQCIMTTTVISGKGEGIGYEQVAKRIANIRLNDKI